MRIRVATCLIIALALSISHFAAANDKRQDGVVSVLQPRLTAPQSVVQDPVPMAVVPAAPIMSAPAPVVPGCCTTCCRVAGRCCLPPVPTMFCLVDPCGCSHQACVNVPACCVGQEPIVTWRDGVLGRQVATLCWPCCNERAKVIVKRCGKVKVRD